MYCPDGFETLAATYFRIGNIAEKWSLAQPRIKGPVIPGWNTDETEAEVIRREAYQAWLWRRFAKHTAMQLYATSPQGVPVWLDIFSGNFWAAASPEFPEDPKEQAKLAKRGGDIYYYIRPGSFTVDSAHSPPNIDFQQTEQFLAPLDGWPVCWKPTKEQFTDEGLAALLVEEGDGPEEAQITPSKPQTSGPSKGAKKGRPPKIYDVQKAIAQKYPNGVGMPPQKVLTEEITIHINNGLKYSLRTVQRALELIRTHDKNDKSRTKHF